MKFIVLIAAVIAIVTRAQQPACRDHVGRAACLSNEGRNILGGTASCAYCAADNSCTSALEATVNGFVSGASCEFPKGPVSYVFSAASSTCEAQTSSSSCLKTKEGGEACAFCSSGAVGDECIKESDAKALPSSVFQCQYAPAKKMVKASGCEAQKSESACLKATENGDTCAYCESAAVSASCMPSADAKTLPTSVFHCTYAA